MKYDRLEPTMQNLEAEIGQLRNALENIVCTLYEGQKTMLKDAFDLGLADKADAEYDKGYDEGYEAGYVQGNEYNVGFDEGYAKAVEVMGLLNSEPYKVLKCLFDTDDVEDIIKSYPHTDILTKLSQRYHFFAVGDEVATPGGLGLVISANYKVGSDEYISVLLHNGKSTDFLATLCTKTGYDNPTLAKVISEFTSK